MPDDPREDLPGAPVSETSDDEAARHLFVVTNEERIGDHAGERIEVGHGGIPVFLAVVFAFVFLWALIAWKPWGGY